MAKRIAVTGFVVAALAVMPGWSQKASTSTDPKAADPNGPPAFTLSQGDKDNKPDTSKKALSERPVSGFVTDADGKPVTGAIVQLKNTRTLQVRSYITREKGDYYFAGLSKDVDYELKAQSNGKTSAAKTLSSFDTKPQPVINLQIK
jgi:hypothetical protein